MLIFITLVLRSVFGGLLPSLKTNEEVASLRESGYHIDAFANAKSMRTSSDILESGIESMLRTLDTIPQLAHYAIPHLGEVVKNTSNCLLETILDKEDGLDFFRSMPKDEITNFARHVLTSSLLGTPLRLVSSTCPDYVPRSYLLQDGVGIFAERTMSGIERLKSRFDSYQIPLEIEMHLADGDVADESALLQTGETKDSFARKITSSIYAIRNQLQIRGMSDYVSVVPMTSQFDGINEYGHRHLQEKSRVHNYYLNGNKRVVSAVKSLLSEREQLGDFDQINDYDKRLDLVIGELAGYTTYGQKIAGEAVIISPGAKSVVPAYNFGLDYARISPVVYVYEKKSKENRSLYGWVFIII